MKKYKILLIEDSLGDARIFQEFLNEASLGEFEIHQNIRLDKALENLKTTDYDLIVTDLNLPDNIGIDTFTTLKENVVNTPIIVFSGNNNMDIAIKAMELGAQDYIIKGRYDKDTLYRTIRYSLERKKYEERLRESDQKIRIYAAQLEENTVKLLELNNHLKELNLNKDKFYSILSHDLLNPLNALQSFSELLYTDFETLSLGETRESLLNINALIRKIINLLKQLLLWSGVNTGRIESKPENLNILNVLQEQKAFHQMSAFNKNISLIEDLTSAEITADKVMVETVIRNLISNAIKFTPADGKIVLRNYLNDGKVIIEIEDTGVGMDDEEINRLFKIGSNIIKAGTNNERGIGLGLLICREFVVKNQGSMNVNSRKGSGSKFSITFPKTAAVENLKQ